jgi:hypothetical protein
LGAESAGDFLLRYHGSDVPFGLIVGPGDIGDYGKPFQKNQSKEDKSKTAADRISDHGE